MGISGLLPALKGHIRPTHIRSYSGLTVAVDGYCWLHRGVYACSEDLGKGIPTTKYLNYCLRMVHLLLSHGVRPYMVFDGAYLPAKAGTETDRSESREKNRAMALQKLQQGDREAARQYFIKAAEVTPQMAWHFIQELKRLDVKYVVAPYEADAQLAFLARQGIVDAVISEDSDCLPYGCPRVLFKLDANGEGTEIILAELFQRSPTGAQYSFLGFTHDMFLEMCILSGCDYLPSLAGVGLKKAYSYIKQHKTSAKVIRWLQLEGKVRVPPSYSLSFLRAKATFKYQRVFNPTNELADGPSYWLFDEQCLEHLTPLTEDDLAIELRSDLAFLGPTLPPDTALAIASGLVDPISRVLFAESNEIHVPNISKDLPRSPSLPAAKKRGLLVQKRQSSLPVLMPKIQNFFQPLPASETSPPTPTKNDRNDGKGEILIAKGESLSTFSKEAKEDAGRQGDGIASYFSITPTKPTFYQCEMEEATQSFSLSEDEKTTNETQSPEREDSEQSKSNCDEPRDECAEGETAPDTACQPTESIVRTLWRPPSRACIRMGLSRLSKSSSHSKGRVSPPPTPEKSEGSLVKEEVEQPEDTLKDDREGSWKGKRSYSFLRQHRYQSVNAKENIPPSATSNAPSPPQLLKLENRKALSSFSSPQLSRRSTPPLSKQARRKSSPILRRENSNKSVVPATPSPAKHVVQKPLNLQRFSYGHFTSPPTCTPGQNGKIVGQEQLIIPGTPSPTLRRPA